MLTEEALVNEVQSYLKQNMNIHLSLPEMHKIPDSKVTLKFIGANQIKLNNSKQEAFSKENRYVKLIRKSQQLLNNGLNQKERVSQFGTEFFLTITQDIRVLMSNQQIRKDFSRVRQRILFKEQQIEACCQRVKSQCLKINDKEDVVTFIQSTLKQYFQKIKNLKEHYEGVKAIELFTSINIDNVYQQNITSEEDYSQHFEPLLQVMQRLKSNLMKIYQQIFRCEQFEVPLKCVNFLANCRNLLLQLELFLMDQACTYNRLIFYVVQAQRRNLLLVTSIYENHLDFATDIVNDTFKCFFFGYIFKDYFRQINLALKQGKRAIIKIFEQNQNVSLQSGFSQSHQRNKLFQKQETIKRQKINIVKVKQRIRVLSRILGCGKDSIMHQYIRRKQCKKMGMVVEMKIERNRLEKLIENVQKYSQAHSRIEQYLMSFDKMQNKVNNDLRQIEKGVNISTYMVSDGSSVQENKQKIFRQNFIRIQESILQISGFIERINQYISYEEQQYFSVIFFPKKMDQGNKLITLFMDLETRLLNAFETMRKQKQLKKVQAHSIKGDTVTQIQKYLSQKVPGGIGFEITNEDGYSEEVKVQLQLLDRAMYMVETHLNNQQQFKELQKLKVNLEWLLVVFEGSMDDRILETMIDKLDFQRQDWKTQHKKLQDFMKDISTYLKDLKNIQKAVDITKIDHKVLKIIKDRTQLYQIIHDIFTESIAVFSQTKRSRINIQLQGVKLFDQNCYKQVLKMYRFKNKLRTENMQLQQLLIPQKTKNYLTDEIYQPFMQKFYNHICYSQEELLNLTLRFQHAITLDRNLKILQNKFLSVIEKQYHQEYFSDVLQISADLIHVGQENVLVKQLQQQKIVIHNMVDFKEKADLLEPYIKLAKKIQSELPNGMLRLQIETKNQNVVRARNHLKRIWNQKNGIEQRSQLQGQQKRSKLSERVGAGRSQQDRDQKQRQKQNDKYGFILGKNQQSDKFSDQQIANDSQYDLNKIIHSSIKSVQKKLKENMIDEIKKVDPKQIVTAVKNANYF